MRQVSDLSSTDQGMWELREGGCREPLRMGRSKGTLKGQGSCYTPSPEEASTANPLLQCGSCRTLHLTRSASPGSISRPLNRLLLCWRDLLPSSLYSPNSNLFPGPASPLCTQSMETYKHHALIKCFHSTKRDLHIRILFNEKKETLPFETMLLDLEGIM